MAKVKKIVRWKIYIVVVTVLLVGAAKYLFQQPFVPSLYTSYTSEWKKYSLDQIRDELDRKEKVFTNLRPDCEKKIGFFNKAESTELAFAYIPGFSATRKEIFPVMESLSKQFSANYFLTRFPAHGQEAEDYRNLDPQGFFDTAYEAVDITKRLGRKKIFVATSTGATLVSAALVQDLDIDAAVFIAPAYQVYPTSSWLLSTRLGEVFNFIFSDEYRSWTPHNPVMSKYWNTSYHRDGVQALLQTLEYVRALDFSLIKKPVLVLYTKNDDVVVNQAIFQKFAEIKAPHKRLVEIPSSNHVLAGEYTSPETTELVIKEIHDWIQTLNF